MRGTCFNSVGENFTIGNSGDQGWSAAIMSKLTIGLRRISSLVLFK